MTARTFHVLLLETNVREAKTLLPLAEQLALDRQGKITILSVLLVPEGEQMSVVAKKASRVREEIKSYLDVAPIQTRIKTHLQLKGIKTREILKIDIIAYP